MQIKRFILGPLANNCFCIIPSNSSEIAVIDAPQGSEEVVAWAAENNYSIKYVILTHNHYDHTDGLSAFPPEIPVIHHKDELEGEGGTKVANATKIAGGEEFQVGDITLKTIHTPGHTLGGICIYANGHLFSGDTLFCRNIGRADLPGGNLGVLISSIKEKLLILPEDTKVYPGHGPESTISVEKEKNPYLN